MEPVIWPAASDIWLTNARTDTSRGTNPDCSKPSGIAEISACPSAPSVYINPIGILDNTLRQAQLTTSDPDQCHD